MSSESLLPTTMTDPGASAWHAGDFEKITNEELVQLAGDNVLESEAYFELWRRKNGFVVDMVSRRMSGQDARHMVTTFFCHKLPKVLHQFRSQSRPGSFDAWLATVLRNYLNDAWRRGKARRQRQVEMELTDRVLAQPAELEARHEQEHLVYFLRQIMLQVLSAEDRYIFRARYWEDKTLKEIAEEIGCSPESVRVRHWRAKKRLHKACAIYRESGLL